MIDVIINADDFGMSEAFNYGVIKGYKDGVVSSTTLMVNMEAAEHAVSLAKSFPDLFIGQHTNLVLGKPCSNPQEIPSLVDEKGYFWSSSYYRNGSKKFVYEDVKKETIEQMEKFKELLGYYPQHIEGHSVFGEVIEKVFKDIALEYNIHASLFSEKLEGYKETVGPNDFKVMMDIMSKGISVDNILNDDLNLLNCDGKIVELHFHPGYLDQFILDNSTLTLPRCKDLDTLCDGKVVNWFKEQPIRRISFGDLRL
ncbi:PTS cellbiose transporter subunit IIC [Clostridium folliculivorans]|uniref:PTS cellbiose transporter subunit IIC n=1 Tax=Clostridium folliculivorans TaxID=2886038 RepID=A0A9W5Y0F1_9CLOT|nr:ChbG/HpnK family deacetylase [Clostridium folliculivorans]GKU24266.1 PTS cellbiose transporter subunit IIC [Clostridium folliculivorans]